MARNLVVCLDGTRNEPEMGTTNVVRAFDIAVKDKRQLAYYDPGVGTMGARSATTRVGKSLTVLSGLVMGHGIKENLEEVYTWLMRNYGAGDRIFVFGFSRGAYTALALSGMLRAVGLLRPGADNLVPYALELYAQHGNDHPTKEDDKEFFGRYSRFNETFGNPDFNPFAKKVYYLGIWDTVKSVGWFNWRAKYEEARWPFTNNVLGVHYARHALAIHEKRWGYAPYRLDPHEIDKRKGDLREMWFKGVHSDVGGVFEDDHRLSDIALHWVLEGAIEKGLRVDEASYEGHLGRKLGEPLAPDLADGKIHHNQWFWAIPGLGWRRRGVEVSDELHPSVCLPIAGKPPAPSTLRGSH